MQSAVSDTNKKIISSLTATILIRKNIKIPSLTDKNSHYVFRLKLFITKTILDILNSTYTEYISVYSIISTLKIFLNNILILPSNFYSQMMQLDI